MAALGERTSRVTIGTSVATPTFRYHPSIVAQAFGTLGCLAPDRIILGVGTGEALNETPATGMEWPAFKERFGRLRESIELIRLLWKEQRVTFDGQYYQTVAATIYDRPARQIPIYIAAAGPTATRLAGRIGDGFITTSGKAPELYRETLIPNLQVGLEKSGRHMDDLDKMIEMKVSFDTDHERALNDTRHWAALALSPEEKTGVEDPEEMEKLADTLPVERAASRWIVSTDPEEHIEKIEPYLELGFNHLVFHAPGPDQERFLRLYAKEVLPRLRKKFAIE
jgi:coenzyme F420-dependent glucose-6-phosphate dehydrogenase